MFDKNSFKVFSILVGGVVCVFMVALVFYFIEAYASTTSTLRPISDGGEDSANWVNAIGSACNASLVDCYTEVDESSGASCTSSDGDTTHIESSTNGANQTFDIDLSSVPDNAMIEEIAITVCAIRGAGGAKIETRRCVDGVCSNHGTSIGLGTSYAESTQTHSGLAIRKGASTDIEVGVSNAVAKTSRVSQIYATVTYDTTAPSSVTNLAVTSATTTSVSLSWTSPGDDGSTGTATTYDIRYATTTISDGNWSTSTQATGEPAPSVAGSSESFTITGLTASTTYYIAMKTSDEVPNESGISNTITTSTAQSADITHPSDTSDLAITSSTASTIVIGWTASGDDGSTGTATSYDVRYNTATITSSTFATDTQATGEPAPSVAGSSESFTITGLTASTTYYIALQTTDDAGNDSDISNIVSSSTLFSDDSTAPSSVTNLAITTTTPTSFTITWTSPGDDGSTGTATSYDVRYSPLLITSSTFETATQATGEPTPSVAGSSETMDINGLVSGFTYYIAIKSSDEVPNESDLSNVASGETPKGKVGDGEFFKSTIALFSGLAYPDGVVTIFRRNRLDPPNAQAIFASSSVHKSGAFSISLSNLIFGDYLFTVRARDVRGDESGVIAFSPDFLFGDQGKLVAEGIFVPPSVRIEKSVVIKGNNVLVSGYAVPSNSVNVIIDEIVGGEVFANDVGYYVFTTSTSGFSSGVHRVRVQQSEKGGRKSNMSSAKTFSISTLKNPNADLNNDNKVNITDWSIFLSRWGSVDVLIKSNADMNGDGIITVVDLSIFLNSMEL